MDILKMIPRPVRRTARVHVLPPLLRAARWIKREAPSHPETHRYFVPGSQCFQGYYDITPVSDDREAVLAHVVQQAPCRLTGSETATVGYFEISSGRFVEAGKTNLWSWQLGARLMWVPGSEKVVAFNGVIDGQPCYVSASSEGVTRKLCDVPLFDVNFSNSLGISLNFGRLAYARPGYGYGALEDPFLGQALADEDGLFAIDLETGEERLVTSMPAFAELVETRDKIDLHYLNAAKLSATGKRYSVLYKTIPSLEHPYNWNVNALVGTLDGNELTRVPLPGNASHYWWIDDERIVYTSNRGRKSEYLVYNCQNGVLTPLCPFTPSVDGHPSLHATSGRWVTDTYPDLYGEQSLYLMDVSGKGRIGVFQASRKFSDECRCDLHPRWNRDGTAIYFDSTHEGLRAVYCVQCGETKSC